MQHSGQRVGVETEDASAIPVKVRVRKKPTKAVVKSSPKTGAAVPPPPAPHKTHRLRTTLFVAAPVLGVVVLVWLAGNVYMTRYQIGTTVMAAHTSTSDAGLGQVVARHAADYRLRVTGNDGATSTYALRELGLQPDVSSSVASAKQQRNAWRHRLMWWKPVPVTLTTKVNMATLNAFIAKHITKTIQPAHDATIALQNGEVHLTAASAGKQYGLANPVPTILAAVEQLQAKPLRLHLVTQKPAITKEALTNVEANIQRVLHQHITIEIAGQSVTPKASDIASWLQLTPKPYSKTVNMSVDQAKVQAYIGTLAAAHARPPRAQVNIAGGATIPGERGTTVAGQAEAVASIGHALLAAKGVRATLSVQYAPFDTINAGSYDKWFEVDLTNHRMYAYHHSSLVRTFLVSAGKYSTPTVTGDYAIYSKFTSQTMRGADYVQPNVPWVNYFYRDFAIHGNYWSPASYFGSYNASHGCVGVQVGDAAWIYTWAPIGTHVLVHT